MSSGEICTDRSNNVGLCPETAEYIADGICDATISMGYNNLCKKLSQATKSNQITTLINNFFYKSTTKEVRKDYLKYLSQINPSTHKNKEAIEFLQKYLAEELMMLTIPDDLIAKIKPLCQKLNKIQQNLVFTETTSKLDEDATKIILNMLPLNEPSNTFTQQEKATLQTALNSSQHQTLLSLAIKKILDPNLKLETMLTGIENFPNQKKCLVDDFAEENKQRSAGVPSSYFRPQVDDYELLFSPYSASSNSSRVESGQGI